jgi:flagellar basal-body rod modification protein FlgD
VGNSVTVATSQLQLDGTTVPASYSLDSAETSVTLVLTGSDQQAHRVTLGSQARASTASPGPQRAGPARGQLQREAGDRQRRHLTFAVTGQIQNIRLSTSGMTLNVSHLGEVSPADITQFNGKS